MGEGRESRPVPDSANSAKRTSGGGGGGGRNKPIPSLRTPLSIVRPNRSDSFGSSSASSPVSSAGSSPSGSTSFFMNLMRSASSSRITSPSSSKFSHSFSSFLLRRKPSRIDLAMCEERERCCEDEIERRGLALMEPRPIDLEPTYFANNSMSTLASSSMENLDPGVNIDAMLDTETERLSTRSRQFAKVPRSPPYVMGGIIETMSEDR